MASTAVRVALVLVLVSAARVEGQPVDLEWLVSPMRGFDDGAVFGVYAPAPNVDFHVAIVNDEQARDWVNVSPGFFGAVSLRLVSAASSQAVAAVVRWGEVRCSGPAIADCGGLGATTGLPPGGGIGAMATVEPLLSGQAIEEGEYRLELDFRPARPFLHDVSNQPWLGRMRELATLRFVIRTPRAPIERMEYYRIEGTAALRRGDLSRACDLFEAWVKEFPDDPSAHGGLGIVLLESGRFEEAAPSLEKAFSLRPRDHTVLSERLAAAYIGMKRDAAAIDLLRRYIPVDAVPEALERARRTVSRVTARRDVVR